MVSKLKVQGECNSFGDVRLEANLHYRLLKDSGGDRVIKSRSVYM